LAVHAIFHLVVTDGGAVGKVQYLFLRVESLYRYIVSLSVFWEEFGDALPDGPRPTSLGEAKDGVRTPPALFLISAQSKSD